MKPPVCCVCQRSFDPPRRGDLVRFARTEADKQWDEDAKSKGFTGHPPYAEWFCDRHLAAARNLQYLTLEKALPALRRQQWRARMGGLFRHDP